MYLRVAYNPANYSQRKCKLTLERIGTVVHFFEAALAVAVALLCIYMLIILLRICRAHQLRLGQMSMNEMRIKTQAEQIIFVRALFVSKLSSAYFQWLAVIILIIGLLVFILSANMGSIFVDEVTESQHPLLVIHSVIYRSCLSLSLIIYPALQVRCFGDEMGSFSLECRFTSRDS